jgi:hypothetical protein
MQPNFAVAGLIMKYEKPGGMKTILFFLLLLFCIPVSIFGINGNGSYTTPYNGSLTADMNWSGTVYVNGDVTVDGYTLTISPGTIIVFLNTNANLIITGTGMLSAIGTSGSNIRFTADSDNTGTYGGPGETWGHLSFQGMGAAGTSNIEYCIFEYGRIIGTGNSGDIKPVYYGCGGAIYADFNNIVIKNCIFRSNYAYYGGAIYINGTSPSISNCYFVSNEAREAGGAISLFSGSGSLIENCLFQSNHSYGLSAYFYSGGAIFFGPANGTASVVNSTFVQNTSDHSGDAVYYFDYSLDYQVKNSIFWGSNDQLVYKNNGANIINCAIEGNVPSGSINCIVLNSSNTALDGPNFATTDGSDWSIKFVSPCRDAGTSIGTPVTDIIGTPRFGPTDIGAYENQYSRWTGSTSSDWGTASNWFLSMLPSSSSNVVIPHGTFDPIISADETVVNLVTEVGGILNVAADQLLTATTLTNAGTFTFQPNAKGAITTIINNGILNLQADATSMSSLIVNNTGVTANIDLYLTGGGGPNYNWHYISSPITYLNVSTFAPTFTYNVAAWNDDLVTGTLVSGWVAYDGYVYVTKTMGGPTFDNLARVIGIGYDYYAVADLKYTLSGQINTSDVPVSLSYAVDDALHGFNLLGNPFSSGLNWDDIVNSVHYAFPANTSKTLYFTRGNVQCSYVDGVGVPGDVTGIIPPMQGFFIKTNSAGNTITLAAGARVNGSIHARYKGSTIIPLVRLSLNEGPISDETVVRFDPLAKTNLDYDFDALKMFVSTTSTQIYSALGGTDYSINGQPFPDTLIEIPIVLNLTIDGNHNITVPQLQGLDNYDVTLTDKTTGFTANLKTTPTLSFSASAGTIADRFVLKIGRVLTGIENTVVSKNTFNIYPANSMINIQTLSDAWEGKSGSVKVMDLTGKTVGDLNNAEFSKNSLVQVAAPGARGIYMVEVKSGYMRYVGKVVIR